MAAQPIWAINILYFRAEGAEGEANKSAETAPNGATVIESPFGVNNWSSFPNMATARNAPAEGHRISLKEGVEEDLGGFQFSHMDGETTSLDALIITFLLVLLKPQ